MCCVKLEVSGGCINATLLDYQISHVSYFVFCLYQSPQASAFDQVHTLDRLTASGPIPGVDVYCMYGVNLNTVTQLGFRVDLLKSSAAVPSTFQMTSGDSVVPIVSLRLCDR